VDFHFSFGSGLVFACGELVVSLACALPFGGFVCAFAVEVFAAEAVWFFDFARASAVVASRRGRFDLLVFALASAIR
jgi:hypothetical protein